MFELTLCKDCCFDGSKTPKDGKPFTCHGCERFITEAKTYPGKFEAKEPPKDLPECVTCRSFERLCGYHRDVPMVTMSEGPIINRDPAPVPSSELSELEEKLRLVKTSIKVSKKVGILEIKNRIASEEKYACEVLLAIFDKQTSMEQSSGHVDNRNSVGFSKFDSELMTSFAKQYRRFGRLSPKQMAIVQRRMMKYAGQAYRLRGEGISI